MDGNDEDMDVSRFGAVGNAFAETQKTATAGQMYPFLQQDRSNKREHNFVSPANPFSQMFPARR